MVASVPDILRAQLEPWWERALGDPGFAAAHAALPETLRDELPRVAAGSEFVAAALIRDPGVLEWLRANDAPEAARAANAACEAQAAKATASGDAQRLLREWRRRE